MQTTKERGVKRRMGGASHRYSWLARGACILGIVYPLVYLPWTYRAAATKAVTFECFVAFCLMVFISLQR